MRKLMVPVAVALAVAGSLGSWWVHTHSEASDPVGRYQVLRVDGELLAIMIDTATGDTWRLCPRYPQEAEPWDWCYLPNADPGLAKIMSTQRTRARAQAAIEGAARRQELAIDRAVDFALDAGPIAKPGPEGP